MTDVTTLVDRYIEMWNETDTAKRRALIADVWTADAIYVDPALRGDGRDGIHAMVGQVHERFPGHVFRRTSDVDAHNGRLRFGWELAREGGPPVVKGVDFAAVADGRLSSVTGFFDAVASPPST